jgi:hypothetical protein
MKSMKMLGSEKRYCLQIIYRKKGYICRSVKKLEKELTKFKSNAE